MAAAAPVVVAAVHSWLRRPDVGGVFALLHPLLGGTSSDSSKMLWTYSDVRDKLRPALIEWDLRQGPHPSREARGRTPQRLWGRAGGGGGDERLQPTRVGAARSTSGQAPGGRR